jgi:hypothetical protein
VLLELPDEGEKDREKDEFPVADRVRQAGGLPIEEGQLQHAEAGGGDQAGGGRAQPGEDRLHQGALLELIQYPGKQMITMMDGTTKRGWRPPRRRLRKSGSGVRAMLTPMGPGVDSETAIMSAMVW